MTQNEIILLNALIAVHENLDTHKYWKLAGVNNVVDLDNTIQSAIRKVLNGEDERPLSQVIESYQNEELEAV